MHKLLSAEADFAPLENTLIGTTKAQKLAVSTGASGARRQKVLRWLVDPAAHFPAQHTGDLAKDGVCVGYIADKLGIAQPSATAQMRILQEAGLVASTRIAQWTFYRRDEEGIKRAKRELASLLD